MVVLGIETSCDETSAAVIDGSGRLVANVVLSQQDHARYGGVVPELASRAHVRSLLPVIDQALDEAGIDLDGLDGIAVTCGPGLVGSLLVGVNVAKGLAFARGLALIGVHHLEGHLFSATLEHDLQPPFVALLVSGGHSELIHVTAWGAYRYLGRTLDDAAGEAFDKVAKLLDLLPSDAPVAGGRAVSDAAAAGNAAAVAFPRPLPDRVGLDFSFSGLKTAVRSEVLALGGLGSEAARRRRSDLAASFQAAVVDVLTVRAAQAIAATGVERLALVGGVAANRRLRERLQDEAQALGVRLCVPSATLCTDNAGMIAAAGRFRMQAGQRSGWDLDAHPRLPLPGVPHA